MAGFSVKLGWFYDSNTGVSVEFGERTGGRGSWLRLYTPVGVTVACFDAQGDIISLKPEPQSDHVYFGVEHSTTTH
jgi:hypothetical protein